MTALLVDETTARVEELLRAFPRNPLKHGVISGLNASGKKDARTVEPGPVTPELVAQHLHADPNPLKCGGRFAALGYLPGDENGTDVGALDLDGKDYDGDPGGLADARGRVIAAAARWGVPVYVERSTSGNGFHVWVFLDAPLPHATVRLFLQALAREAGLAPSTETYPAGAGHASTWIVTPYAGALSDPKHLGRTFLEASDGRPLPLDELHEVERFPSERAANAAASYEARKGSSFAETTPRDLAPESVPLLLNVARSQAPKGGRHFALAAFLNMGHRAGRLGEMVEGLKGADVRAKWAADGSRNADAWAEEVGSWAEHIEANPDGERRGLPYLTSEAGFKVPDLPKLGADGQAMLTIAVNGRHLRDLVADTERLMARDRAAFLTSEREHSSGVVASNFKKPLRLPALLLRGRDLVRPATVGALRVEALTETGMRGYLTRAANFVFIKANKIEGGEPRTTPALPPLEVVRDLLDRAGELPVLEVKALSTVPLFTRDGRLVKTSGYDPGSGFLLDLRGLDGVTDAMPVADAVAMIDELLCDFNFDPHDAGRAGAFAVLLHPFTRPLYDGPSPLFLIEAPKAGAGKGLLAQVLTIATFGEAPAVTPVPEDESEFSKTITSLLVKGSPAVLLDNAKHLHGAALAAVLTSDVWTARLLTTNRMAEVPNTALWLATGNNVIVDEDTARRTIGLRFDPGVEHPGDRTADCFRHPGLCLWTLKNRPRLVSACLSLVRAWFQAGRPQGATLGSFEGWARATGGILGVAEVPGLLVGRKDFRERHDPEGPAWAGFLAAMHAVTDGQPFKAGDCLPVLQRTGLLPDLLAPDAEGKPHQGRSLRLIGHGLNVHRDQVHGEFRLRRIGQKDGSNSYRVVPEGVSGGREGFSPTKPLTPQPVQDAKQGVSRVSGVLSNLPRVEDSSDELFI